MTESFTEEELIEYLHAKICEHLPDCEILQQNIKSIIQIVIEVKELQDENDPDLFWEICFNKIDYFNGDLEQLLKSINVFGSSTELQKKSKKSAPPISQLPLQKILEYLSKGLKSD